MREPQGITSGLQPGWLLLLAVLALAVAVTACSHADERSAPPSAQWSGIPHETASIPAPTMTARPYATAPVTKPPPVPMAMPAAAPVRLQISSIGVDSELVDLGLQGDGTLEVPSSGFPAGWYTGAPTPGELGPAIMTGHVDWGAQPGVFFNLRQLSPGDDIAVTRQDGSTARFAVTHVEQFDKDAFPTQAVYGDLDHAGLRLITCGGSFDPQMRSYEDNLVVFAELVDGDPARVAEQGPGRS